MSEKKFVFICGAARSGTTALWKLLSEHQDVAIGLERYKRRITGPNFDLRQAMFEKERFFTIETGDTFYNDLTAFDDYYKSLEPRYDQCRLFGDKVPRLFMRYAEIDRNFDRPKILFLLRNIFDVAASFNKRASVGKDWAKDRDYRRAVIEWNQSVTQTIDHLDHSDILVIEYKTLFYRNADIGRILRFLGLDKSQAVQQRYRQLRTQAVELQQARGENLTIMQKLYIARHAMFGECRRLLKRAAKSGRLLMAERKTQCPGQGTVAQRSS